MQHVGPAIVSIIAGILGVTIVAVLVSQRANTSAVIGASASGLSSIIGAAVSPITGGTGSGSLASAASGLSALNQFGGALNNLGAIA